MRKLAWCLLILLTATHAQAGKIRNRQYGYKLVVPDGLREMKDSASGQSTLYFDTSAGVLMMLSGKDLSGFRSVDEYMSCARPQLEQQLKADFGDSTLELERCFKPVYYPKKMVGISFKVAGDKGGFNYFTVYFVHHRQKEIQISFTYCDDHPQRLEYIGSIMQSFKLTP